MTTYEIIVVSDDSLAHVRRCGLAERVGIYGPEVDRNDASCCRSMLSSSFLLRTIAGLARSVPADFACIPGFPALVVRQPHKYIPTFTLPRGYNVLTVITHIPGQSVCSRGRVLISGAMFQFNVTGNYDYCALFSSQAVDGLASFALNWSNPGLGTQNT